ncbi:MAG: single-stranded-DNA-specific exonuclease RecJ [Dehalococcoidia bacterium]
MAGVAAVERIEAAPSKRRRWRGRPRPIALPPGDWPDLIGRLLAMRGFTSEDDARAFLHPPGPSPDPLALPGMSMAIERLALASRRGETVAVFGDFDVDGVTSVAQFTQALLALGARPLPYVPDRFREGYGLNIPAIEQLHAQGAAVLVTADCGTSSVAEVARARELGMDVLIFDHHTVPPELPPATALVNPRLQDHVPGGLLELATAGLAFHAAAALHDALGRQFDADAYIDAAALGTVCDMAPLTEENRRIVQLGLPVLARTRRPGLRALMAVSGVTPAAVDAEDIGYRLGPRINAAGRIQHADLALELLLTQDEDRAQELAARLDELNRERQQATERAVALAVELLEGAELPPLIMVGHPEFPAGIVGLVASKLVTLYGRPAVVYEQGPETSRASCRSIDAFHITDALRTCAPLFVRFGGHRQAAGFTAENARLGEIRECLVERAARELAGAELVPVVEIDAQLPLRELRGDEIRWLARLAPFGVGNPEPAFLARDVTVVETRLVGNGEKHLRLKLRDGGLTWTAIAFDMGDTACSPGDRIDVVYSLSAGGFDNALELRVEDFRPAGI